MPAFEEIIRLQLQQFGPEGAKRQHIAIARKGLATFLARQSARPFITLEVDGHPASSEEQVRPFGVITYRFSRMREVVQFALDEARRLSPERSGRYKKSWFAMLAGGARTGEVSLAAIPPRATVIVTNDQPYSRKINVGAKGFERYAPPGIVEKVRQLVLRKYRALVTAEIEYVTLAGGYVLKNDQFRKNRHGKRAGSARRDARAGMRITYPALRLAPRV